jgi:hypothetical protein
MLSRTADDLYLLSRQTEMGERTQRVRPCYILLPARE